MAHVPDPQNGLAKSSFGERSNLNSPDLLGLLAENEALKQEVAKLRGIPKDQVQVVPPKHSCMLNNGVPMLSASIAAGHCCIQH